METTIMGYMGVIGYILGLSIGIMDTQHLRYNQITNLHSTNSFFCTGAFRVRVRGSGYNPALRL